MSTSTKLWCYSLDDETFNSGSFLTKEDAIIDAVKEYEPVPGAIIHIARTQHPELSELFDIDDLLEGAASRAYDVAGEYSDGFPDISVEEKEGLEQVILSYLQPLIPIRFYNVTDSEPHTITLSDLEIAARYIDAERSAKLAEEMQ